MGVGAGFGCCTDSARFTVTLNAGSEYHLPSLLTEILMFEYVPTSLAPGVPESLPVRRSKCVQEGRFAA